MTDADLLQKLSSTGLGGVAVLAMLVCLKMVSRIQAKPSREWLMVFGACCLMAIASVVAVLFQNRVLTSRAETLQTKVTDQRNALVRVVEALDQVTAPSVPSTQAFTEEPESRQSWPEAPPPESAPASDLQETVRRARGMAEPFLEGNQP